MSVMTDPKGVVPSKFENELSEMDSGVLKNIPVKSSLMINATSMTQAQIDGKLKGYLSTFAAADKAKQQYEQAVLDRRNVTIEARDLYLQLKKVIIAYFGARSPILGDFGLTPAKPLVKDVAKAAAAAAKRVATRKARGTTSKKQKAKVNPFVSQPDVNIPAHGMAAVDPSSLPTPPAAANAPAVTPPAPAAPEGSAKSGASTPAPAGGGTPGNA